MPGLSERNLDQLSSVNASSVPFYLLLPVISPPSFSTGHRPYLPGSSRFMQSVPCPCTCIANPKVGQGSPLLTYSNQTDQ